MLRKLKHHRLARHAVQSAREVQKAVRVLPLPPHVKEALRTAEELRKQQRLGAALEVLEPLAAAHPSAAPVFHALSVVYYDLHMRRRSQEALAQAVMAEGNASDMARRLAKSVLKQGKSPSRDSIGEVMRFVRELGFQPATIIDVGVNTGTPGLADFFPQAKLMMVDPLEESVPFMQHIASIYADAHYDVCAAAAAEGELTMCVYPSYGGSTVVEVAGRLSGGVDRKVPAHRLDALAQKYQARGPYVLKIDTEGAELDVLAGATALLPEVELLILETRLRPRGITPDFMKLCDQLRAYGFLPYDVIDRNYDRTDATLKQMDMVAVRINGFFRTEERYRQFKAAAAGYHENVIEGKLKKREQLAEALKRAGEHA